MAKKTQTNTTEPYHNEKNSNIAMGDTISKAARLDNAMIGAAKH